MDKPTLALFDFDGTLTLSDTLPLFMRHATGWGGMLCSMLSVLPAMSILACNGWKSIGNISAGATKEKLLHRCFKGKALQEVEPICTSFASTIDNVVARSVYDSMLSHIEQGHTVVIVSASVDKWILPWASQLGVSEVIATQLQVVDDKYTGRFMGKNCNGEEKVRRIAERYSPHDYHIIAYGNSSGDYPMFDFAHQAFLCNKGNITQYK